MKDVIYFFKKIFYIEKEMKKYITLILFFIIFIFFYFYQKENQSNHFIRKNDIPYFYEKNINFKSYNEEKNKNDDMKIYEIMSENLYKK
jgi:hypothetical protein